MAGKRNVWLANNSLDSSSFIPGGTALTAVKWVDMQNFRQFVVGFLKTVGTGTLTALQISASTEAGGAGDTAVIEVKDVAGALNPDAVDDEVFFEIHSEQLAQATADNDFTESLRYVSAEAQFAVGSDEAIVTYVLSCPRFASDGLTSDSIA